MNGDVGRRIVAVDHLGLRQKEVTIPANQIISRLRDQSLGSIHERHSEDIWNAQIYHFILNGGINGNGGVRGWAKVLASIQQLGG